MNFIRQWLTRPIRWALFLIVAPLSAAALGLIWLDTAPGKRLIERATLWATARYSPVQVELTGLGGALPFEPSFERLRLSDAGGVWLEVEGFSLRLDPMALLRGALEIPLLSAARIAATRLPHIPAADEPAPEEAGEPFDPASLPVRRLRLGDVSVAALEIGADLTGGPPVAGALRLTDVEADLKGGRGVVQTISINNNTVSGFFNVDVERLRAEGRLSVVVPDIGAAAAAAGQDAAVAAGRATLEMRFSPRDDGSQGADLTMRAEGLAAAGHAIGEASVDLSAVYRHEKGPTVETATARIAAAGLTLNADGGYRDGEITGEWRLAPFELRALARFVPALAEIDGRLSAEGAVAGTPADPQATAQIALTGGAHPAVGGAGIKPLSARVDLRWADGTGRAEATAADADKRLSLEAKATIGDAGKTLDARVKGALDVALFNELLAAQGDAVSGRLNFNAAATGDPAAPKLSADAAFSNGSYHLEALGANFSNITLRAAWDGKRATIDGLGADTPQGGKIAGRARVDMTGAAPKIEATLTARNALLADSTLATVAVDADLTVGGTPQAAKISGETTLKKVDIRIPRQLPGEVTTLEVVEVGGGRAPAPPFKPGGKALKTGVQAQGAAAVVLDVGIVAAPRRVKVTGQGFDGEFGGRLTVRGTAETPDVTGRFTMQRGALAILGRNFRFTRGVLNFDGGPEIDPRLDVLVETKAGTDTARIKVEGSPRRPEIRFESAGGLPEDQVVSQILFGKTTDKLSPAQGVELAQALASLTGFEGPAGVLGKVRSGLGLDRLDVGTGVDGKVTVEAGRMVADGVFVGVRQTADGPKGRVEVELTDSIKVEAGVGAGGAPEVGVGFEIEY